MLRLLSVAVLLFAATPAAPIVIRHDKQAAASIELARPFTATVRCEPDGSGTLIDDRWVLTAAHVARLFSPFQPRMEIDGELRAVRQVRFHPKGQEAGDRPPEVDLALVELEEPVEGIRPVPLYREREELGRPVVVVGYGDHGKPGAPFAHPDGRRRAATNTVANAEGRRLHLVFDEPPSGTELEGVGGPGDSGGSLYLQTEEGPVLLGVSSGSTGGPPGSYGVTDLYVRVSDFLEWIDGTRERAAKEPPRRVELEDLSDGFPEGEGGELLDALFTAFALGEREAFDEIAAEWRSAGAKRRNPGGAFGSRLAQEQAEVGALEPDRLARVSDSHWAVLARSERAGWLALHLRFKQEAGRLRLDDLYLVPEAEPAEDED